MEHVEDMEVDGAEPEVAEVVTPAKRGPKPKKAEEATAVRRLPVKLIRNYHPADEGFTISGRKPTPEEMEKVFAGAEIEIEVSEAQTICTNGIAVRNDPFA